MSGLLDFFSKAMSFINLERRADAEAEPFEHPTPIDVAEVKAVLQEKKLPPELVDIIIDEAEYWPRTQVKLGKGSDDAVGDAISVVGIPSNRETENCLILRSLPLG